VRILPLTWTLGNLKKGGKGRRTHRSFRGTNRVVLGVKEKGKREEKDEREKKRRVERSEHAFFHTGSLFHLESGEKGKKKDVRRKGRTGN